MPTAGAHDSIESNMTMVKMAIRKAASNIKRLYLKFAREHSVALFKEMDASKDNRVSKQGTSTNSTKK